MRFLYIDDILRGQAWAIQESHLRQRLGQLLFLLVAFGLTYGLVMGSYPGDYGPCGLQMLYSALKVPVLLMGTFLLSLPSFFVVNSLLGLRDDFGYAMRALIATQVGLTIVLASFAPFTILWYVSFANYRGAILFNTLMFATASVAAQRLLKRFYQPLIDKDPRHRKLLRCWIFIYGFVGIQMGWLLRPFIGNPEAATTFFRDETWGNAYIKLIEIFKAFIGF